MVDEIWFFEILNFDFYSVIRYQGGGGGQHDVTTFRYNYMLRSKYKFEGAVNFATMIFSWTSLIKEKKKIIILTISRKCPCDNQPTNDQINKQNKNAKINKPTKEGMKRIN